MGWTFYDTESLPEIHSIVWCKRPRREDRNITGRIARPVLVRETQILEDEEGTQYGAALISYASTKGIDVYSRLVDLCIEDQDEVQAAGLHMPTRFSLDVRDSKLLPWCIEYFVAPEYVKNAGLALGKLTAGQSDCLRELLRRRGTTVSR